MSKIIQLCYRICNKKKAKLTTEALHFEGKKDSSVQLHHDEKTRTALSGGALEECKETAEDTTAEIIDTPIGKHETAKTIIMDKKQAIYFHVNKSELEAKEDMVNDIIMKTGKTALGEKEMTPVEQMKAAKKKSSKSSVNILSEQRIRYRKASAKRGFLNKSTREGKWWKVSKAKNYRFTGHKAPGEQTILVQSQPELLQTTKNIQHDVSPEMLNFSEIVPDLYLNSHLLEAFQDAFQFFRKDKTNRVDMNDLQFSLSTMRIYLTHQDAFEALKSADIDGDGKVNFSDFLAVLTDNQRFLITIDRNLLLPVSEQEYLDTVLFDAISRMLQKSCLPARSIAEIAKYYQEKFEAIPPFPKKERSKSHIIVNLASDARIMSMTDKQLVQYLKKIKTNKGSCSSSPYDVIPCVPLSSRKETKLSGHPQLHRLMQKTIYKRHKEISDVDMQKDVDLGKKPFLERAVRRKQSTTLHLWDRIQGEQIEQETRNPVFYDTFSTYSWSWDAQRELLAKKKLYQRETKKQWETASAPLGPGIQQSHVEKNAEHSIWEKSDEQRTDILSKSSLDFHQNPNVIEKPEKKDFVQE
ncbi:EF-hand calcium-binding domain-containing protein 3 isoform X2 [Ranitomeya variabilis]|uniref:EF-hand calcium-binding domain-containing protein 3 isoform X2 n=1 Tax=Ranitomeya variabilis TaxID=490064 RepID=UPI0040566973